MALAGQVGVRARPRKPDRRFGELLVVVGGPAGDAGDGEDRDVVGEAGDPAQRTEAKSTFGAVGIAGDLGEDDVDHVEADVVRR